MKQRKQFIILKWLDRFMNRFKLKEKIIGLFIFCVMVPLICTDGIILSRIQYMQKAEELNEAEDVSVAAITMLTEMVANCESICAGVKMNKNVGLFLSKQYESPFEYYESYHDLADNSFFQSLVNFSNTKVKLYTTNETIINGGYVGRIDAVKDADWYQQFEESGKDRLLVCCYEPTTNTIESNRKIYYLQKLVFLNNPYENFIRVDVDYSTISRRLVNMRFDRPLYICDGDLILMSNRGMNNRREYYETFDEPQNVAYSANAGVGNFNRVLVMKKDVGLWYYFRKNYSILLFLLVVNIALPVILMLELDHSIIYRIEKLDQAFGKREDGALVKIDDPDGEDEIGALMTNYNLMADRINELIQIVYKDKLQEQEMSLAKKNAELLALQSQINPHFMFNALESIRMHSVIKGERETAEMVEKLAIMERQYVDWGSDMVAVSQEMASVEAYLGLQKYRFGEKLMYELSIDEDCQMLSIPKLTIVTFVENACVHGMENKTSGCWVFVRVNRDGDDVVIEVEDTGNGMSEEMVASIQEKAYGLAIDDLKGMNHVGIYNALLRLRMTAGEGFRFEIESEEGVGTLITIRIPQGEKTC